MLKKKSNSTGQLVDDPSPVGTDMTPNEPSLDLAMADIISSNGDNPDLLQAPVIESLENETKLNDVSEHSALVGESPALAVAGSEGNADESDVHIEPGMIEDPGSIYFFNFVGDYDVIEILKSEEELVEYGIDKVMNCGFITFQSKSKAIECIGKFNKARINNKIIYVGLLENIETLKETTINRQLEEAKLPKFITLKMLPQFCASRVKKCLEAVCGKIERHNIKEISAGKIIIQAKDDNQAKQLLLFDYSDKDHSIRDIFPTRFLNQCKGIVSHWLLKSETEETLKELNDNIFSIQRIKRKFNGSLVNTNSVIITFDFVDLSTTIDID